MNIDSINQKNPELSMAVASILKTIQENVHDPFYRVIKNKQKIELIIIY